MSPYPYLPPPLTIYLYALLFIMFDYYLILILINKFIMLFHHFLLPYSLITSFTPLLYVMISLLYLASNDAL